METNTEAGVESASKILPLLHILTDADLNITGLHHTHRKSKALLGDNSTYVGRHVSSIDVIRYLMRDHQWESLQKLMRGKWVEIRRSYKNFSDLKLQIVPILVQEELKGFIFRVEQVESITAVNGINLAMEEIISSNLQTVFNASQDIFFLKDQNFRFVFVNDAFCRFYQVKREDVLGKTDYDFLPKELADKYHYLDREAIEGKVITVADEANMNDKVIEYKKFIIRDPIRKQPYIAVVARDVTYWRQIIHMLETKQREFEYFFNNNLFGAFFMMSDKPVEWNDAVDKEKVLDYLFEHQKVTRVNQEFLNQYRAKAEDIIGFRPGDFFGADITQARSVWRELLDEGRLKTLTYEVRRDGTHMTVDGDYVAIYDEYGRFLGHFGVKQDVTEKVEQEKKLEEYRQLIEESFRVARMGGWELDLLTNKFRWTSHLYEILEFQESFEPKLENFFDFVATESERNRIRLLLDNSVRTGERVDTEVQFITGKGRIIWISMSAVPVMKNNRCIKLFGIVQNIHDSKIKADQLLHSELRFKSIVDSAPGIIFVTDLKGRVTYISQNVEEFLGFPVEELVQKQLLHFVGKEDQPHIAEVFDRIRTLKINAGTNPHRVRAKDGTVRWFKTNMSPLLLPDGTLDAVMGIALDITEIIKTEEALAQVSTEARKMAAYYKSIVENQSVYVIKLDDKGKLIFFNELFVNDFVLDGKVHQPSIKRYVGVQEGNKIISVIQKLYNEEIPSDQMTFEVFSENKKVHKFIHWEFRLVREGAGSAVVVMGFGYDITELMKAYEKTRELLRLTEDQNLRLQNFAYIISHNIRSHWANMQGLMNIMRFSEKQEDREQYLELIGKAISNLGTTIEELNQILNIRKEYQQPRTALTIKDEINLIKDTLIHEIVEAGARIDLYMPHNLKVRAVPAYLSSIFLNLFTNALKYRAPERPLVIEVHAFKKDDRVVIRFSDNGMGIDLQKAKGKIFGLYKTFHNHPQARGFGLYIVKTQVEAMNGSISVESEPGVGTAFTIELPA